MTGGIFGAMGFVVEFLDREARMPIRKKLTMVATIAIVTGGLKLIANIATIAIAKANNRG